jgi:hypothetical protein
MFFATPSLEILGHRISATGAATTADHPAEIKKLPTPSGHQATAMFPWHGKLLPPFFAQVFTVLKPLSNLLRGGDKTLEWTVSTKDAKRLLPAGVPLQHPAPNAELCLAPDASDTHIKGSCNKNQETIGSHLASFPANSQTQNPQYSTFNRKLLAAHEAIKHFSHFFLRRSSFSTLDRS